MYGKEYLEDEADYASDPAATCAITDCAICGEPLWEYDNVTVSFGPPGDAISFSTNRDTNEITVSVDSDRDAIFSGREFAALVYLLDANISHDR